MNQGTCELAAPPAAGRLSRAWRQFRAMVHRVDETLALWHFRARSRRELARMEDRLLRDAGVDRLEAFKPFWKE